MDQPRREDDRDDDGVRPGDRSPHDADGRRRFCAQREGSGGIRADGAGKIRGGSRIGASDDDAPDETQPAPVGTDVRPDGRGHDCNAVAGRQPDPGTIGRAAGRPLQPGFGIGAEHVETRGFGSDARTPRTAADPRQGDGQREAPREAVMLANRRVTNQAEGQAQRHPVR
ncbi:hypothetical protein ebA5052 [Aromatoleum aromaticum EbN1]|uniref:Uncharacterized protein n=1 Tax=Aromatoleum aromaticum (strain DSM 19018 / LMG 30748 / EbN1) TaxID=76114 RepID=Q5P124_AROAE|nr:hypothetical protein ebA5052 [Aromatoleum aromaticum EbN1]